MDKFLQDEQEEFKNKLMTEVWYDWLEEANDRIDWLSAHDSRLIAKIREMIPTEKIHQLPDNVGSYHETEHDRGWNDYRKALLSLLPDNTNVCEK